MAKTSQTGKYINCGGYKAFVPNPLPPEITWTDSLMRSLSDADRLIGELSGSAMRFPNPHLLTRSFVKCEAVLSSRIEGTQTTLGELFASDAGATNPRNTDDLREVSNYVAALDYGIERLNSLPLSLRLVRELHEKLMQGVRGDYATPGEFRKSQNWIGASGCTLQNASYIPPSPELMAGGLADWEMFMHSTDLPPLLQAAMLHYQFEAIHPFLDGNGRVGRLLILLFLLDKKVLSAPILHISAFFEAMRPEYYRRLTSVTKGGQWNDWLEYFLNGVARMSEDVLSRAERINRLLAAWREKTRALKPKSLPQAIDMLAENPYITANKLSTDLSVAFTTAQRVINTLDEQGIIVAVNNSQRGRTYCAQAIMRILDEPLRIR